MGSRGLHVVVDVIDGGDVGFDLTSTFARRVAEIVSERGGFTLEFRKSQRGGRLFPDIFRSGAASHAVAPYSLRPIEGAPIAAPLDWEEAPSADSHLRRITIADVFRRLAKKPDPWADPPRPT